MFFIWFQRNATLGTWAILNLGFWLKQFVYAEQIKEHRRQEAKENAQNEPGPFSLASRDKQPDSDTNINEKLEN